MNLSEQWRRIARSAVISFRLGMGFHWAVRLLPWVGAGLLMAGICVRYSEQRWSWLAAVGWWGVAILVVAGIVSLLLVRSAKSRFDETTALQRLDTVLGTNNALSSAAAGQGRWPEVPAGVDHRLRIAWRRIMPAFAFSLLLTLSGALIPLPAQGQTGQDIPPPRSHEEIASTIAQLEKAGTFEQKQLEELKKQLDSLRNKPASDWYSHANIEAADHLQAGMLEQVRSLQSNLNKAASGLETLKSPESAANSAEQQQAAANFKSAMEKIKSSNPGLNEKLMQALSKIDPSALKSLSGKDLQEALSQMKQAAGACKQCSGQSEAQSELNRMLGGNQGKGRGKGKGEGEGEGEGDGDGYGDGQGRSQTGKGGVARGPGVAPLPLSDDPSNLETSNPESLQNSDLSRTGLGDAIGTSDTEHTLDKNTTGPQEAGAAAGGAGGEAVSHESLLPSEKALLKGVFR